MNALQAALSGATAAGSAALPAGAVFILLLPLTDCTSGLECFIPYAAAFAVVLGIVAASAWLGVRYAQLSRKVAIMLATLPFSVLTLTMVAIAPHAKTALGVVFWGIQLCISIYIAHRATRRVPHELHTRDA